jgi:hypothetical protein
MAITTLEEAGVIPGKNSDTRIKPLPLASGHGRCITIIILETVGNGRYFIYTHNRYKCVTVSLPTRLRNGRFNSETAVRQFHNRNDHLDLDPVKMPYPLGLLESST